MNQALRSLVLTPHIERLIDMLQLAEIFQSGMVLQREKPLRVWGRCVPGAAVTVTVQGNSAETEADAEGAWSLCLPALSVSASERLCVQAGEETLCLEDVAVGEVWIVAGQSNAEFAMRYESHLAEVKPGCANPLIRFYDVPELAFEGQRECFDYSSVARWRKADPENIEYFSAVGYYLARKLSAELSVPVGIVGCNWGGSVSASWMDPETVRRVGPAWTEAYEAFANSVDWEDYWQRQKTGIQNDRGDLLHDPFNEFVMPRTRTPEEMGAFAAEMMAKGGLPDIREGEIQAFHFPGALYEHMVRPLAPFPVRGVAWYQGESDDEMHRSGLHQAMLTGLIGDWRRLWGEDLPFLIVQLPGYERWLTNEADRYDLIRAAQEAVTRTVEHTWLCSVSDAGERYDIHPKNKLAVGERLALLALGHIYGQAILCDAPRFRELEVSGSQICLRFDHAEGGLRLLGGAVQDLQVCSGGKAVPFRAEVQGNQLLIVLEEPQTEELEISFAQGNYFCVNLLNQAGIPALPFCCKALPA